MRRQGMMWMDIDLVPKRRAARPAAEHESEAPLRGRSEPGPRTAAGAAPDSVALVALILTPTVILLLLMVALA